MGRILLGCCPSTSKRSPTSSPTWATTGPALSGSPLRASMPTSLPSLLASPFTRSLPPSFRRLCSTCKISFAIALSLTDRSNQDHCFFVDADYDQFSVPRRKCRYFAQSCESHAQLKIALYVLRTNLLSVISTGTIGVLV